MPASAPASAPALATTAAPSATGEDAQQQWCTAYASITKQLSRQGVTPAEAKASLAALESFDQLWAAGANLGLVSAEETAANHRAIVAYAALVTLIADGKAADSTEVSAARNNLTAVTDADKSVLQSSASKITTLCAGARPAPSES